MDILTTYIKSVSRYGLIDRKHERRLFRVIRAKSSEEAMLKAKTEMVNANLRLVVSRAVKMLVRFPGTSLTIMDLISEGNIALIGAVNNYRPTHKSKAKFSTYATKCIDSKLIGLVNSSRPGIVVFLDDLITSDDGGSRWQDVLNDENAVHPNTTACSRSLLLYLEDRVNRLPEKEKEIIKARYLGVDVPTLDRLSKKLNISKERVRQKLYVALRRLRRVMVKEWNEKNSDNKVGQTKIVGEHFIPMCPIPTMETYQQYRKIVENLL